MSQTKQQTAGTKAAEPKQTETALATAPQQQETALATTEKYTRLARVLLFTEWAKGDRPAQCAAAGVGKNEFYLLDSLGIVGQKPFTIIPTTYQTEYWVQLDRNGKALDVIPRDKNAKRPETHTDGVIALVLVCVGDSLVPAILDTKKGACQLWGNINSAKDAAAKATKEQFASRGGSYKAAAEAKFPFGRVAARIYATKEEGKNGPWVKGHSGCGPTSAAQVAAFNALAESGEIKAAAEAYQRIVKKLFETGQDEGGE